MAAVLIGTALASSAAEIRQETTAFRPGASSASIRGSIKGDETVDYRLEAKGGQTMVVDFKHSNRSAYFNVLPPGSGDALFVGSSAGDRFDGALPSTGAYTIRVYLMRNAARRNEKADYTLSVKISGPGATATPPAESSSGSAFDRTLERDGIRFHVTGTNDGSMNTLKIVPSGLEIDNTAIERRIEGTVTGADIADINADRSPELYVFTTSAGSGSYGSVIAYSANRRKSLSEIYLPPIAEDKKLGKGYMGHDEFAIVGNRLVQRFPVYRDGDTNAKPTGGTRQIQYKLKPGEAGWLLTVDGVANH
jgi:hypothetical protein